MSSAISTQFRNNKLLISEKATIRQDLQLSDRHIRLGNQFWYDILVLQPSNYAKDLQHVDKGVH